MAYSSTVSAPYLMTMPPVAGGYTVGSSDMRGGLWYYTSTDPHATVRGTGYFTDGFARGMHLGDPIFVRDASTAPLSLNFVSSVSSTGVTISQLTT